MKKTPFVVDVRPVRSEKLSSSEFLKVSKESPGLIERASFHLPRLGSSSFGKFEVRYSRVRHRMTEHG